MPESKTKKIKKINVAAIQMVCKEGQTRENLKHAQSMVEKAVKKDAKLVLLPELMPSGYMVTEAIWDFAETMDGQSATWLKAIAKKHGIHIGFSFLEAEGEDFYNTFILATPKGDIAGRVRKSPAASIEANFYKPGDDSHVIETDLGRIGISICYENMLYDRICELSTLSVDIVLSPSAAGRPKPLIPGDVERLEKMIKRWRCLYSDTLGVPNVVANRVGLLETELPGMLPYLKSSFAGLSAITSAEGVVLAELGDAEGILVEEVELNPSKKKKMTPKRYGKMWAIPVPWYSFLYPMTEKSGEERYKKSQARPIKAKEKSSI